MIVVFLMKKTKNFPRFLGDLRRSDLRPAVKVARDETTNTRSIEFKLNDFTNFNLASVCTALSLPSFNKSSFRNR